MKTRQKAHLLHDKRYGDSFPLRAFRHVQLPPKQRLLQIVREVFLLHEVKQGVVTLVLPDQPQRLWALVLGCSLFSLKCSEELSEAAWSGTHQTLVHPDFGLTELLGLQVVTLLRTVRFIILLETVHYIILLWTVHFIILLGTVHFVMLLGTVHFIILLGDCALQDSVWGNDGVGKAVGCMLSLKRHLI